MENQDQRDGVFVVLIVLFGLPFALAVLFALWGIAFNAYGFMVSAL